MQTNMLSGTIDNEAKKKIIIVNNNMKIGGVQKALLDLLNEISPQYDVTLCLLNSVGEYIKRIPADVKVICCNSLYKYFGMGQAESKKSLSDYIFRSFFAVMAKIFGRQVTTRIISCFSKKLPGQYDCAISYMHDGGKRLFYGGCNDFVISKVTAKKKITFVHGDYENCGSNNKANNEIYDKFDIIAACSEGCRKAFLRVLPHLEAKTKTVINCHNFEEILAMSREDTVIYDNQSINAIVVSRLNPGKGVDRAICAAKYAIDKGLKLKLHIVGGGNTMEQLKELSKELQVESNVLFYGEQANPYRYIKNADFLLLPSYHEAAPLVIDEALCLGVPVLSTATTSSEDMILNRNAGWVCDNSQEAINQKLHEIVANQDEILRIKKSISVRGVPNNSTAIRMLQEIIC